MINNIDTLPTLPSESSLLLATLRTRCVTRCVAFIPNRKVQPKETTFIFEALPNAKAPLRFPHVMALPGLKVRALLTLVGGMASVCVAWTVWLILLTLKPNETVNWVMKTENFDEGSFWLMVDPPVVMNGLSVCGFLLVGMLYISVLVRALRSQHGVGLGPKSRQISLFESAKSISRQTGDRLKNRFSHRFTKATMFLKKNDQYARVWMKIGDLLVETIVLYVVLEDGSPIELVVTFTAIVTMNAFSCALMMILPDSYTGLTEVIIDIVFDFLFAVAYPMLTVIYCFSSFSLDHVKLTINMEVFPLGAFEREASVIANPAQTDIIYKSLKSLQISSAPLLISRVGVNLVFASRLYHTVGLIRNPEERPTRLYPKRHCLSIAFLLLVVAGLIVFVEESVRTSSIACQAHPECVVKAHRWITVDDGSLIQCPCRTLIDVDIAPKSYEEWMSPVNVTAKVVQLASTGDLRTIKLTNRYLPVLPENLRWCREMQYMSLMYTYTQRIPDWASEFANLQYFYIEGASNSSLVELPDDLFADMTSLTFIHLGSHPQLKQLPSFVGLENLKALVLALLDTLVELPTFDSLYNLKRIELAGMPTLTTLPDLKSLQKLESFIVSDRGTWCCNGFLGECNLNNSFCTDDSFSGISAATCLPSDRPDLLATNATLAIIEKFNTTVCHVVETESGEQTTKVGGLGISFLEKRDGPDTNGGSPSDNGRGGPPPDTNSGLLPNTKGGPGGPPPGTNGNSGARAPETKSGDLALPTPETITPCGGILYRRCNLSGYEEAMCYNARFTAISCDSSSLAIEMRRRQIQKGVGDRCNPDYEAWLGCK